MSELPQVVDVAWLQEHLGDADLVVGDVRGPNAHARGHIPRSRPLVLGLDFGRRRIVRRAVRTANPSADPVLQYVELTEARRLALQYKTSVWALGVSLVVLFILAAVYFADGNSATVFVLAALAVFAVIAGTWSMLTSRGAQRYLERLGYDPRTLLPRGDSTPSPE